MKNKVESVMEKAPAPAKKNTGVKTTSNTKIDPILKELLESGAHFGHQSSRWNPQMADYIFGVRGGVHIIDLTKTAEGLKKAESEVEKITKNGGQVLFVATKRQAAKMVAEIAKEAGMPFVTYRWLGGMLTNLDTINSRILRLKKLETQKTENNFSGMTKKEKARIEEEMAKLGRVFEGVRDMYGLPAAVFVVDMPREHNAILEARKLGLPVIAMADTNADPNLADYIIAANDDAVRSIELITKRIATAAKAGAEEYRAKAASETNSAENAKEEN